MARLRTLYVGTKTVGDVREEQHILVLDRLTPDEMEGMVSYERKDGIPPVIAFGYDVDLPGVDADRLAMPDTVDITTHADAAQGRRVGLNITEEHRSVQDTINRLRENAAAAGVPEDLVP